VGHGNTGDAGESISSISTGVFPGRSPGPIPGAGFPTRAHLFDLFVLELFDLLDHRRFLGSSVEPPRKRPSKSARLCAMEDTTVAFRLHCAVRHRVSAYAGVFAGAVLLLLT
jgi:hypothetical protein